MGFIVNARDRFFELRVPDSGRGLWSNFRGVETGGEDCR